MRWILPTRNIQDSAPIAATTPTKMRAPTNEPVSWTMLPITSGVTMPDRFAEALKSPPISPIWPGGATSEITDQPEDDMAWAKKGERQHGDDGDVALQIIGKNDGGSQQ